MFSERKDARATDLNQEIMSVLSEEDLQAVSGGTDSFTLDITGLKNLKNGTFKTPFGTVTVSGLSDNPQDIHINKTW